MTIETRHKYEQMSSLRMEKEGDVASVELLDISSGNGT